MNYQCVYVYIKSESSLWTVGFYTPDGDWVPESDYATKEQAAARVHYLNGGDYMATEVVQS